MRGGRSPGFARMSPDIAVWKCSFPLVKEHGDPPRRSLQKHQRCGACGRRDGASGGAAGAGEFWRHRAPRFRRHCCTAARYLRERFQALACFLKAGAYGNITPKSRHLRPGWQCLHVWKSRTGSALRTEWGFRRLPPRWPPV